MEPVSLPSQLETILVHASMDLRVIIVKLTLTTVQTPHAFSTSLVWILSMTLDVNVQLF